MRIIVLTMNLSVILFGILGCARCNHHISWYEEGESVECQKLKEFFDFMDRENKNVITTVVFFDKDNESLEEFSYKEFKEIIFSFSGCCICQIYPSSIEWIKCNRLDGMWEILEKESIQKIAFYEQIMDDVTPPQDWYSWAEITERKKINRVQKLLYKAMLKENDKYANTDSVMSDIDRMQVITDKHKFIIPISCQKKAVYGIGWTSYELRRQLREWGFAVAK